MQISYELTSEGTTALARSIDTSNATVKRGQRRQWIGQWLNRTGMASPILVIAFFNREGLERWLNQWWSAREFVCVLLTSGLWLAAWFVKGLYGRRNDPSTLGRLLELSRSAGIDGPAVFEFDEKGVREAGDGFDVRAGWRQIERIDSESEPNYIFLWSKLGWVFVIPRGAFLDETAEPFVLSATDCLRAAQLRRTPSNQVESVEFEQTTDDLIALRRYYLHRARGGRFFRLLYAVFVCLPLIIVSSAFSLVLILSLVGSRVSFEEAVPLLAVLSCLILVFAALPACVAWGESASGIRRWAHRRIRRGKVGCYFLVRKRITIGTGGVRVYGEGFDSFSSWEDIERVVADPHHLFLLQTHAMADLKGFIIPRLAFSSEKEFVDFCAQAEHDWRIARSEEK